MKIEVDLINVCITFQYRAKNVIVYYWDKKIEKAVMRLLSYQLSESFFVVYEYTKIWYF